MKHKTQKPHWLRRKLIVYPKLQVFVLVYGTVCAILGSFITNFFYRAIIQREQGGGSTEFIPILMVIFILLGVLIMALAFSNKVFGPIYRLHKVIKENLEEANPGPITLRSGDEFKDLISDFNQLVGEKEE